MAVNSLAGACGATLPSSLTVTPGVMLASEAKPLIVQSIPSSRTGRLRMFTFLAVVTGEVQRSSYEMSWETQCSWGDLGQVSLRAFSKATRYSFKYVGGIHGESEISQQWR